MYNVYTPHNGIGYETSPGQGTQETCEKCGHTWDTFGTTGWKCPNCGYNPSLWFPNPGTPDDMEDELVVLPDTHTCPHCNHVWESFDLGETCPSCGLDVNTVYEQPPAGDVPYMLFDVVPMTPKNIAIGAVIGIGLLVLLR